MKKILFSLAVLALAAACGQNSFKVNGTITDADQLPEGAVINLIDANNEPVATADITDGKFTLTGEASQEKACAVTVSFPDKNPRDRSWMAVFIPEKGTTNITLSKEESDVQGGPVTKAYNDFQAKLMEAGSAMRQKMAALTDEAEADKLYEEYKDNITGMCKDVIAKNPDNFMALYALQNIMYDLELDELDEILAKCGKFVGENENVKRIRDGKVAEINTGEGKPFADFSGKTPEGADIKLSDIVGKGRWVLADFWASWCGPCMGEIPNIKKTHEALSGDKFTVLGVAVWDADDNGGNSKSLAKMEQMGMTWPQIFVGDDKTPTDLYGIAGIPTMILFAPDGTICKRGEELRGEQMMETVRDIINQ